MANVHHGQKSILRLLIAAAALGMPTGAAADIRANDMSTAARRELRADPEISQFYASRNYRPVWFANGQLRPEAYTALRLLKTADLDGLDARKYLHTGIENALAAAKGGNPRALARAEILLSRTFADYVGDVRRPRNIEVVYAEAGLKPPRPPSRAVLQRLSSAPSLETYLRNISWMHPIYAKLRAELEATLSSPRYSTDKVALLRANLDRASILPGNQQRYILVDTASARLDYVENGEVRRTMRVIVGSADHPTPMMVGMIRYATLNPYWHVPTDLTRERIAPRVLKEGLSYFKARGYEVVSEWSPSARKIDPSTIDWKAVAAGRTEIYVRQKPGPHNGMGKIKLRFPNDLGIYLHDTPAKQLFAKPQRNYSGGCVRLEDAASLGAMVMGGTVLPYSKTPEATISLSKPVPLYITYLTLRPGPDGTLVNRKDAYGSDRTAHSGATAGIHARAPIERSASRS